jgi:hypothetical protein
MPGTDGLKRRVERLQGTVTRLPRPSQRDVRRLADLGDPELVRLGQVVMDQEWLDQLEREEKTARAEAGDWPTSAEMERQREFERGGVKRIPKAEELLAIRQFTERYIRATRGAQQLPVPQRPGYGELTAVDTVDPSSNGHRTTRR